MVDRIPAYILAGGKSSRFGSDKARAVYNGLPLVVSLARLVEPLVSSVTVIAERPGKYDDFGLHTIGDLTPGLGPLGGLQTAIHDLPAPGWLLLLSCDWAGLRQEWNEVLLQQDRDGRQAVVYRGKHWEPLLALYHSSVRGNLETRLASQQYAMWQFVESINALAVPLPEDFHLARNVNTPASLEQNKQNCRG